MLRSHWLHVYELISEKLNAARINSLCKAGVVGPVLGEREILEQQSVAAQPGQAVSVMLCSPRLQNREAVLKSPAGDHPQPLLGDPSGGGRWPSKNCTWGLLSKWPLNLMLLKVLTRTCLVLAEEKDNKWQRRQAVGLKSV